MKKKQFKRNVVNEKETIYINKEDTYTTVGENIDFANGCVIIADIIADVAADVAIDVIADAAADAAADAVADVAADTAADSVADAVADTVADAAVDEGISTVASNTLKNLAKVLGASLLAKLTDMASSAIINAIKNSSGGTAATTTSADYWNSLYKIMDQAISCDTSASGTCGKNQRNGQEAMILEFQQNIVKANASVGNSAIIFEKKWDVASQKELKQALTNISKTNGIPSMVKYMSTYTNSGASGAVLVVATINTLISVTSYVFSD
jgi:hypothetical protein